MTKIEEKIKIVSAMEHLMCRLGMIVHKHDDIMFVYISENSGYDDFVFLEMHDHDNNIRYRFDIVRPDEEYHFENEDGELELYEIDTDKSVEDIAYYLYKWVVPQIADVRQGFDDAAIWN